MVVWAIQYKLYFRYNKYRKEHDGKIVIIHNNFLNRVESNKYKKLKILFFKIQNEYTEPSVYSSGDLDRSKMTHSPQHDTWKKAPQRP